MRRSKDGAKDGAAVDDPVGGDLETTRRRLVVSLREHDYRYGEQIIPHAHVAEMTAAFAALGFHVRVGAGLSCATRSFTMWGADGQEVDAGAVDAMQAVDVLERAAVVEGCEGDREEEANGITDANANAKWAE